MDLLTNRLITLVYPVGTKYLSKSPIYSQCVVICSLKSCKLYFRFCACSSLPQSLFAMAVKTFLSLLLATIPVVASQQCPIQFDGRVLANTTRATFDTSASLFNPSFVFGQNKSVSDQTTASMWLTSKDLTWSKILHLPKSCTFQNLAPSKILHLPSFTRPSSISFAHERLTLLTGSVWYCNNTILVEVTILDASNFAPSPTDV
jgi:hypothetical protein